jgi:hypothetical protein
MNLSRHCRWVLWMLALLAGCNRQDTEALTRLGKKLANRTEVVGSDLKILAVSSWQAEHEPGLASRVAARLRWDKLLADTPIEVQTTDTIVELRGRVRDLEQRRRAVMLAESTAGVEGVRDALQGDP